MTENESAKFRIRPDDNPEEQFKEDNQDLRVDKLSKRITLITILIPCLIGGILFLAYRDIQTRVGQVSDSGTTKVRTLSKDLETSFSSLLSKHEQLQQNFTKKIDSLEKTAASINKSLKATDTAIRYIRAARTADNKKISKALMDIDNTLKILTPVPQNLENIASEIKKIDGKVADELQKFAQTLENTKNSLIKIQADIIYLSSVKTDNKAFELALKNQQENYHLALQKTKRDIDKRIASLERKITGTKMIKTPSDTKSQPKSVPPESKPDSQAKTVKNTTTTTSGSAEATGKKSTTSKPASEGKTSLPEPGSFIEQDIQ